jgi:hypothetical protein
MPHMPFALRPPRRLSRVRQPIARPARLCKPALTALKRFARRLGYGGGMSGPADDTPDEALQLRLVAALREGRVAGAETAERLIETHLSRVLIGASTVYKFKRPVALAIVDLRRLEVREAMCRRELEINRRGAPQLYREVAPLIEEAGGFRLGGTGPAAEWALVMRRFAAEDAFDALAAAGRLDRQLAQRTAEEIARYHARARVEKRLGHAADYRAILEGLHRTESQAAAALGLAPGSDSLFAALDAAWTVVQALIEVRQHEGHVRRGHGDLHLRNLCLIDGAPCLFDALEFDERLATTDVLYDLAFFLMDLRQSGLHEAANAAMNRYWDVTGEANEALRLNGFFMALRAAVRAVVAVAQGALGEAGAYRRHALELLAPPRPRLVAVGGLSGSGKSTVAGLLGARLGGPAGARILRSDVLRKKALGLDLATPAAFEAYTEAERAGVTRRLIAEAAAIAAFHPVIADATFAAPASAAAFAAARPDATGFWLDAPLDIRIARIAGRRADASDADESVARAQAEPETLPPGWVRLNAARPPDQIAAEIADRLAAV